MRDFRFHVASLVAVFLALGVGIFIGYGIALSLGVDPLKIQIDFIRQHDATVEDQNKQLEQDRKDMEDANQRLSSEVRRLATLSVAGRLSGKTVSLVSVGPAPPQAVLDSIWNTLLLAGARRLNETIIHGSLIPPESQAAAEMLARVHAQPAETPADAITDGIGRSIGSGIDPMLLPALSHRNVPVDPSGVYGVRPDLVVLLSEIDSSTRLTAVEHGATPETGLVQSFLAQGLHVVECESSMGPGTAAAYFRRLGVSSVDNADTPEGRVALVWAFLSAPGHYGVRPDADSLFPGPALASR